MKTITASLPPDPSSKVDLLLHPVRLRIVRLLDGGDRTVLQIGRALADVPQATLYRHLNKLLEGGVVRVAGKRPVRGATERTFALRRGAGRLAPEDLRRSSGEAIPRLLTAFAAMVMSDFQRALAMEKVDPLEEGIYLRQMSLSLSRDEVRALSAELDRVLEGYRNRPAGPGRRLRTVSAAVLTEA